MGHPQPEVRGRALPGIADTTWPTVAMGASATSVYTNPFADQAKLRLIRIYRVDGSAIHDDLPCQPDIGWPS